MPKTENEDEYSGFPYVVLNAKAEEMEVCKEEVDNYDMEVLGFNNSVPVLKYREAVPQMHTELKRNASPAPSKATMKVKPMTVQQNSSEKRNCEEEVAPRKKMCSAAENVRQPVPSAQKPSAVELSSREEPTPRKILPVQCINLQKSLLSKPIFIKGFNGKLIKVTNITKPITGLNVEKCTGGKLIDKHCQTEPVPISQLPRSVSDCSTQTTDDLSTNLLDFDLTDILGDVGVCYGGANESFATQNVNISVVGMQPVSVSNYTVSDGFMSGKIIGNTVQRTETIVNSEQVDWKRAFCLDLINCSEPDSDGYWPIHRAVMRNDVKGVYRQTLVLKMRKLDINQECDDKLTPFQLALLNDCHKTIFEILLCALVDLSVLDRDGNNIFHLAVKHCQVGTLETLLLYVSNPATIINDYNYEGYTPLMLCAQMDSCDLAEQLLLKGALSNLRDTKAGKTALFYAVENNFSEMARLLISFGANPRVCNHSGISVIDALGELECSRTILETILGKSWVHYRKGSHKEKGQKGKPKKMSEPDQQQENTTAATFKTPPYQIMRPQKFVIVKKNANVPGSTGAPIC